MNKYLLLFLISLVIYGCSPISIYNTKMERINKFHEKLSKDNVHSKREKDLAYWRKIKKEFPDYAYSINSIIDSVTSYYELLNGGGDVGEYARKLDMDITTFWSQLRSDAANENARWATGMQNAGKVMLDYQRQQNQYYQNLNDSINTRTATEGCTSDYDCGLDTVCIKKPYDIQGVCGESYDAKGRRTYQKDKDSFKAGTMECTSSLDCPTSFHCDPTYKKCLRK